MENKEYFIETFTYRGVDVDIFYDDSGQQYYGYLDGEEICFGSFNTNYRDDLKYLIDEKLDCICYFENYPGVKLEYFANGYAENRDIRLIYRGRILKIYLLLTSDETAEISLNGIQQDAKNFLQKLKLQ